ncbi:MAG: butyryl-CoA:acetate CoA-transferase [Ruminococcus sp.]|jgi:butyryl-CoA:acetate CoA-transferase
MDLQKVYKEKLTTAEEAVKVVKSGDWLDWGWCTGTPDALDKALAKRMPELHDIKIRGGILLKVPEIFKVENAPEHFCWNSWHMSGIERKAIAQGIAYYGPIRYSELPRYYRDLDCPSDIVMIQVAPMDSRGYFSFGPNASHLEAVCQRAKTIIVEVNEKMPYCWGGDSSAVHITKVDMIVEGENPDILEMKGSDVMTDVDKKVAEYILEEIPDGACLQLGIGGMPNAVGKLIAESDLKDLGVHTEMYVDAYVEMAKAGKINGSRKNIDTNKQVYAFAAGSQELYDYIDNNPEMYSASVGYVNDVRTVSALDNFMSINNAVNIDLFGQVNAESAGVKHISGAGGQLDFVLGAYLSKGGKSFICCSSTFTDKAGNLKSRILPVLDSGSIVTDTRTNTHFVVTEYGKVNLKGLSTWQRCEKLISIAHPDFRDQLIKDAEKMKIWRASNKR